MQYNTLIYSIFISSKKQVKKKLLTIQKIEKNKGFKKQITFKSWGASF